MLLVVNSGGSELRPGQVKVRAGRSEWPRRQGWCKRESRTGRGAWKAGLIPKSCFGHQRWRLLPSPSMDLQGQVESTGEG